MFSKKRESFSRRGPMSRYVTVVLLAILALVMIWYMWQQQFPKDAIRIFEETPNITSVEVMNKEGKKKIYEGEDITPFVEKNAVAGMIELKGKERKQFEKQPVATVHFYVDDKKLYSIDVLQVKEGEVIEPPHNDRLYQEKYTAFWKKHKQQMTLLDQWFEKVLES